MFSLHSVQLPAFVAVASAVLVLASASHATAAMCVDVTLRFADRRPPRALVESMQEEAATLWQPYGLRIRWQSTSPAGLCPSVQASFDVFVDRPSRRRDDTPKVVLGRTRLAEGAIASAPIYIDESATEHVIGLLAGQDLVDLVGHAFAAPSDVGRALGRVLAHEMGHVILGARGHQPRGLMRPVFGAGDLVRHQRHAYTLSDTELTRLHDRELELGAEDAS